MVWLTALRRDRSPWPARGRRTLYFERRRMTCPAEVMPVIVSPLTSSWENVAVASESFRSSPCMAPVTGPERSGRAATVTLPVTFVPVWASVRSTGTPDAPWPAYPDHVPTTLAVGAL